MNCVFNSAFVFFKQKTAYEMRISDWSSDVCSSDLETAGDRGILAKIAVARQRREIRDQRGGVILEVRPFGMARHLGALPGREPCIKVAKLPLGLGLQPFDLGGNVHAAVVRGMAKVRNSRPQLPAGLFALTKRGPWRLALR